MSLGGFGSLSRRDETGLTCGNTAAVHPSVNTEGFRPIDGKCALAAAEGAEIQELGCVSPPRPSPAL